MLIPINLRDRQDLCLSIIRLSSGNYSVAVNEMVNGFGLNPIPSYQVLEGRGEGFDPIPMFMHEFGTVESDDLEVAIFLMLDKLQAAFG